MIVQHTSGQEYKVIPGGDLSVELLVVPIEEYMKIPKDELSDTRLRHLYQWIETKDVVIVHNPIMDELGIYPIRLN